MAIKPGKPGRRSPVMRDAQAIRERLKKWYKKRYPSQAAFADSLEIPRSTVAGWFRKNTPKAPDVVYLLRLSRKTNVSLDWLLAGIGSPEVETSRPSSDVGEELRRHVAAEVRMRTKAERAMIEAVLPPGETLMSAFMNGASARAEEAIDATRTAVSARLAIENLKKPSNGSRLQLRQRLDVIRASGVHADLERRALPQGAWPRYVATGVFAAEDVHTSVSRQAPSTKRV